MSAEFVWHEKVVTDRETGEPKVISKKETVWHMPDGLPDEIPPAESLDMDASLRLIGVMLNGEYEALRSYYYDRRRRVWRHAKFYRDAEAARGRVERSIRRLENFFLHDKLCMMIDGRMVIEKCRAEVYGKEWRKHPDFTEEQNEERS